jgi:hypothetical protein
MTVRTSTNPSGNAQADTACASSRQIATSQHFHSLRPNVIPPSFLVRAPVGTQRNDRIILTKKPASPYNSRTVPAHRAMQQAAPATGKKHVAAKMLKRFRKNDNE